SVPCALALPWCVSCLVQILARFPVGKLPLRLVLADAVGVLDLADELVALAGDLVELVVGQLAPLLLHLAFGLLPVSCDAVPVHAFVPRLKWMDGCTWSRASRTPMPSNLRCAERRKQRPGP